MAVNITPRWGGPLDCSASSSFLIERTINGTSWTTLAASQAAASPYNAPSAVLTENVNYLATSIGLSTTASISASGYGLFEDANVIWGNKNASGITSVSWLAGGGTYLLDTEFYETNQIYNDTNVSPSTAALYRITHTNSASLVSGPNYFWYYYPPVPVTRDHCVVIFHLFTDLGFEPLVGASIVSYLNTNDQFSINYTPLLHFKSSASNTIITNSRGIAYGQYYKNSKRAALESASDSYYTFSITACGMTTAFTAASIPDRDWVFFKDIIEVA